MWFHIGDSIFGAETTLQLCLCGATFYSFSNVENLEKTRSQGYI